MAKTPGQQPGESDRAYFKRLQDAIKAGKEEDIQKRLDFEAHAAATDADDKFLDALGGGFVSAPKGDLEKMLKGWKSDVDSEIMGEIVSPQAAREAVQFGEAMRKGNKRKANKLYKKNKGQWKKAAKNYNKKKENKGCIVVGVLLLGAIGGIAYGSFEGVTAVIEAPG